MFGKIKRQLPISQVTDIELWGWVESQNPVSTLGELKKHW